MEYKLDIEALKKRLLRKYDSFGSVIAKVNYEVVGYGHSVKTAATDGKTIYFNGNYMSTLSEDEQVFVAAHEIAHIALNHLYRSKGKQAKLWNVATDAVINQLLKADGLPLPAGVVDMEGALQYNAEELYEQLLAKKKKKEQEESPQKRGKKSSNATGGEQQGAESEESASDADNMEAASNNNTGGSNNNNSESEDSAESEFSDPDSGNGSGDIDDTAGGNSAEEGSESENENFVGHDDHAMWEDYIKEKDSSPKKSKKEAEEDKKEVDEQEVFRKIKDERTKRAQDIIDKIQSKKSSYGQGDTAGRDTPITDIGDADKAVVNWTRILSKYFSKTELVWGYRLSGRYNNYAKRIEEMEYEGRAEVEVILDVSGSVSIDLLKRFLRQLKIKVFSKDAKLKIGTFANNFNGWIEIKKVSDIDNLSFPMGGGTNFDAASKAFSKGRYINKICFTDGDDGGDAQIQDKRSDILWISWGNPNFKPDNGKVIYISPEQINCDTLDMDM
ncbi:MAG: hypothetical protein E7356_00915 [Clostridiales bacterium]|nr:hypothetical protein [Clostridiales bacterium]